MKYNIIAIKIDNCEDNDENDDVNYLQLNDAPQTLDSSRSNYYDAPCTSIYNSSLDLADTINEVRIALNLFLNNKFDLAEERLMPLANQSMYHAIGFSTILTIKSIMTCERNDIDCTIEVLKSSSNVIENFRARYSITNSLQKFSGYKQSLTNHEIHAELCYAEILMFRAILTIFSDDNFSSFVRGTLKIRSCYQTYKECQKILENSKCWESSSNVLLKQHFESGTQMGNGIFNLFMSTLPSKVLRLLEFVGFSSNKNVGFMELQFASLNENSLRAPLASLTLLSWHLFVTYLIGIGKPNLTLCKKLIKPLINKYPNGALILFLRGRINLLSGNIENAIHFYIKSIESQNVYRQFHHACYWELLFVYIYCRRFDRAANYAKRLCDESKWSLCIYTYFLAILIDADEKAPKKSETVKLLFKKIPALRLRIAGKSIPMEKFCEQKANRYQRLGILYLPHYEFIYFWNGFTILEQNKNLIRLILCDIESSYKCNLKKNIDDWCLYNFLKGVCLRSLDEPYKAEKFFMKIIENQKELVDFGYLAPNAYFEIALIKNNLGEPEEAIQFLSKAKSFKGYLLETKLHFRIHSVLENLIWYKPLN